MSELTPAPLYFVKRGAYGRIFRSKEGNLLLNFQSIPEFGNKPENFSPLCEAERGRGVSSEESFAVNGFQFAFHN
jgi:hypothetical protein